MDLKPSEQLKIYLLRLSQTDCDFDVKHFVKRLYKSTLPKDLANKIYPLCKILSYYYQHPEKDFCETTEHQMSFVFDFFYFLSFYLIAILGLLT